MTIFEKIWERYSNLFGLMTYKGFENALIDCMRWQWKSIAKGVEKELKSLGFTHEQIENFISELKKYKINDDNK